MILPSAINDFLATLPEELQVEALKAIKEKHDRIERGDLTKEEQEMSDLMKELGKQMSETMEELISQAAVTVG